MRVLEPGIASRQRSLEGRHVLLLMLAFFAAIFAVNGLLLYHALATHSGLVAVEPYRKGLAYNQRIAADEQQRGLGWSLAIDVSRDGRLMIKLVDTAAQPIAGAAVKAKLGRPASSRQDIDLELIETAPGQYSAQWDHAEPGAWQADVEVRAPQTDGAVAADPTYRARRRLWLKT